MDAINEVVPRNAETTLVFFVNGKKVLESNPDPEWTLLFYLRKKLKLTGTKYGCGEGGCGACTVMVSKYLKNGDRINHIAVNACLISVCAMHGLAVTTVEGIGSTQDRLHPVQERIAKSHGSQCGFCTPGIVMSMYALLRNNTKIAYEDIEGALQGNLCRCTGYRPIIEGFKTFMEGWENVYSTGGNMCKMGENCCRIKKETEHDILFDPSAFRPYDPTQEPIFPPELKLENEYSTSYLVFRGENVIWLRPRNLKEWVLVKSRIPDSKVVVGNTEIGVEMKFKKKIYPVLISPTIIGEVNYCSIENDGILVGAAVTLTELQIFLKSFIVEHPSKSKIFKAVNAMLHWFAGSQVRNVASLTGNIVTASPISDLNPILMACSAVLNVYSTTNGSRQITIDENFFKGYRKTILEDDEVVISIKLPFSTNDQYFKSYKQARRRDDDISIVTAAFNVQFEGNKVIKSKLCYGGMGPTTLLASKSSKMLLGKHWNHETLSTVFHSLCEEFNLEFSVPGGMAEYRKSLCLSLFFKFYLNVKDKLDISNGESSTRPPKLSCGDETRGEPSSSQYFEIRNSGEVDALGKPLPHASAMKHATGEAIYCDDLPRIDGELFLTLVLSSESHAKIKSIDTTAALSIPGVVAFFCAKDLEVDRNIWGSIIKDEEIFCSTYVTSRSCIVGAIVATSEIVAKKARDLVSITYERLQPVIVTLEDAIEHNSYFENYPQTLSQGNVDEVFSKTKFTVEGKQRSGAQEHFYLETISAYAIRKEDELEIICSSQSPSEIASFVSHTLGIPQHKVIAKVKRIGGGFGGKETRSSSLALPVAIAAYILKKPVRSVLDRDEDIQMSGYRHPFLTKYKVAFDENGKIAGAVFDVFANGGFSMDLSCALIERSTFHVDNCYSIPNIKINAYVCKTNLPSNTAFRGFGAPQVMLAAESMIRQIASTLGKSYEEIVEVNIYKEGSVTYYNQLLTYCTLSRCWNQCIDSSRYIARKKAVNDFNRSNRWKKKGIALVPTKYGISFQTDVLMQAGALLLVYNDGAVLLSIGGIEMGQGLFTKMIQIASKALEIEQSRIHISEAATDKIPNSTATAASMSSDLYGMAVLNACNTLNQRLKPYKTKDPNGKWEDWVSEAYVDRVCLFATGFYSAPKIEYNRNTNSGRLFEYFTYGVACSEVIIDCLTGDHEVLRTDIVMDVGESINPAIDIGQIEGAFMQGYGFLTMEEVVFSANGETLSRGPGTYKIPTLSDIPKEFNVSLLKGAPNPRAVYSSKAIGEPPLFLAASVFFAIKEAIMAARSDSGVPVEFELDAPATCERIRMSCEDDITLQVKPTVKRIGAPWNVIA